jgi:hypothetical protein
MGLLPGEDPSQASAEEAKHWVEVNQELLSVVDGCSALVQNVIGPSSVSFRSPLGQAQPR